jgi:preprotein translocase subunit SecG
MPLLSRLHPLLARTTAVLACVWLLGAQFLLLSHAHDHEHGHDTHETEPRCTLCLFKAAGPDDAAPLNQAAAWALPAWPRARAARAPADAVVAGGAHWRKQARGPPPWARVS